MSIWETQLLQSLLPTTAFVLLAVAPLLMPSGYDALRHSISESAAQSTHMAWVARLGLACFGCAAWQTAALIWHREPMVAVPLTLFGMLMIASAYWSHRSWVTDLPYDRDQDARHSLAAQLAGIAITLAIVARIFESDHVGRASRMFDWVALAIVLAGSAGFALAPKVSGLMQRVMFAAILLWLWHVGFGGLQAAA